MQRQYFNQGCLNQPIVYPRATKYLLSSGSYVTMGAQSFAPPYQTFPQIARHPQVMQPPYQGVLQQAFSQAPMTTYGQTQGGVGFQTGYQPQQQAQYYQLTGQHGYQVVQQPAQYFPAPMQVPHTQYTVAQGYPSQQQTPSYGVSFMKAPMITNVQPQGGTGVQQGQPQPVRHFSTAPSSYPLMQAPMTTYGQPQWGVGVQHGHQALQQPVQHFPAPIQVPYAHQAPSYGVPLMPASMTTYVQPKLGMGFQQTNPQQVPSQFPINDADFRMHENARSMGVSAYSKKYTDPVFVPQQLQPPQQPQPQPQQAQQQQVQQPDAQYDFIMNATNDKIVFDLNKNKVEPAFNAYFNGWGIGVHKTEEKYTKALVLEQKIKAYGVFNRCEISMDDLKNELKDSAGTTHNKINNIFDEYKGNKGFQESIKATLEKGKALNTKSDPRANGLRNALLRKDLTKEEAGQIAKAISIIDAGTEKGDKRIQEKIEELVRSYGQLAPQQTPSLVPSQTQQPQMLSASVVARGSVNSQVQTLVR